MTTGLYICILHAINAFIVLSQKFYNKCIARLFRFGGRFFALNNCYDREFRKLGKEVAKDIEMGSRFHEGVYTMLGGPNFGNYDTFINNYI